MPKARRTLSGPAVQAPTSKGQSWWENRARSGGYKAAGKAHACPARTFLACKPKDMPQQLCGPAMQAPTSKRQGFRKNISLFCDSIVGASNARQLKPCDTARLFGWSRAPPLQWATRELAKLQALFCDFTVGAGLALPAFAVAASLRICAGKGQSWRGNRARSGRYKTGGGAFRRGA